MSTLEQELPATLDEQQRNVVQMQKLQQMTVEPGVMRLPVTSVSTHEDSPKWVIDVEHPVEGEIRFHRKKPVQGYDPNEGIIQLMEWYGIHDDNPYKLQTEYLYVRHAGEESETVHDWELLSPHYQQDERLSTRERQLERIRNLRSKMPERKKTLVYGVHMVFPPTFTAFLIGAAEGGEAGLIVWIFSILMFVMATILTVMLTDPPE